jgi:hypothetical protein
VESCMQMAVMVSPSSPFPFPSHSFLSIHDLILDHSSRADS